MEALRKAIIGTIEGNIDQYCIMTEYDHSDLIHESDMLHPLIIFKESLVRVLKSWRDGNASAEYVQKWASFVRRGYISGNNEGSIKPIDIAYDECSEELIAESLARLEEIGDKIDGEINEKERDELIISLS